MIPIFIAKICARRRYWNSVSAVLSRRQLSGLFRRRSLLAPRPSNVWTLIALNLVAGVASFAAANAPITMHKFFVPGLIFGSLFFSAALVLWIFARHLGRISLLAASLLVVAITSAIVAEAPTPEGAIVTTFGFTWMTIYAASFFSRRDLYIVLVTLSAGCAAAFGAYGIHRWVAVWVLVIATTWTTGIALERSAERLRREADTDSLTGLLNRRGFFKSAALERSVSERVNCPLAIVLIDLDNFKSVNDSAGHTAGDRLLIEATSAWHAETREGDLLARFGGDEFILLLPEESVPGIEGVLDRLRVAHPIKWTAGFSFLVPGEEIDACIERADSHLYQVKLRRNADPLPSPEPLASEKAATP